jgi:hypothetical protein
VTILSKDCSSNKKKTHQDYEDETNHRNAMKILELLFDE